MTNSHDKNEPSRFLGEGVAFKAKLIGILEVGEARGDRMCQEALADLKMAIRAAGEHKQRISVHVAIDGLRLRDEKTGDSLYHHPVHKISFIAQDMSDSRAFGYIFGSPDTGHRFFGIKTDKAASQVVIAMRDLFQVVFELKKKEIELAKQQLEGKTITLASRYISTAALDTSKAQTSTDGSVSGRSRLSSGRKTGGGEGGAASTSAAGATGSLGSSGGAVAELVDLEQELSSLQRGLHQMERLTPPTDPFGDSFTNTPGFLPPPPSNARGGRPPGPLGSDGGSPFSPAPPCAARPPHFTFEQPHSSPQPPRSPPRAAAILERPPPSPPPNIGESQFPSDLSSSSNLFDVFTDLDPLGTGRSKPYVDKKHFFQELKNPPKKVLKDLVVTDVPAKPPAVEPKPAPVLPKSTFEVVPKPDYLTSVGRHSGGSVSIGKNQEPQIFPNMAPSMFTSDPFAETDPFDNTDPFAESLREDPFVGTSIKDHDTLDTKPLKITETPLPFYQESKLRIDIPVVAMPTILPYSSLHSDITPLQVSLPPESKSPRLLRQPSTDSKSSIRQRPQGKQQQSQPSPSPPPPLPPKKPVERLDRGESGPPLPLPARRRPAPSLASLPWEEDYLPPRRPVPSPSPSPGLDITLAQLLTCGVDELADRLGMPADILSRMTIVQLTGHLREYLQTGKEPTLSMVMPTSLSKKDLPPIEKPPQVAERPLHTLEGKSSIQFDANFEDNFAANSDTFVANFDSFNSSGKPSYDRYAVFREIEVEDFKSLPNEVTAPNNEEPDSLSSQPDLPCDPAPTQAAEPFSDIKFESLGLVKKISAPHSKLEELKSVISILHKTGTSPTPDIDITAASDLNGKESDHKISKSNSDRYAALRDLSAVDEPSRPLSADLQDDLDMSTPLQVPKERKRSDEKSDGFDHSDFFDCIDNSLSLVTAEDAFRKSPLVIKEAMRTPEKLIEPMRALNKSPAQLTAPQAMVSGSISDIASGSSPEIVHTGGGVESGSAGRRSRDAWALLNDPRSTAISAGGVGGGLTGGTRGGSRGGGSPWSSEESPPPPHHGPHHRRTRRNIKMWHTRQTSSSSRDVSPWEEDPPPPRDHVPPPRSYHRERHESAGSRERRDSVGSRERRDSGSGRDRHRRRRPVSPPRNDDDDEWSGEGSYSRRPSSREAERRRERGWSHDDRRRPDERGYSTVGRREGRRRGEPPWQSEEPVHSNSRYSSTMGSRGWRRSGSSGEGERVRPVRHRAPPPGSQRPPQPSQRSSHRSPFEDDFAGDRSPSPPPPLSPNTRNRQRHRFFDDFNQSEIDSPIAPKNNGTRFRFSNDFSEKDSPKSQNSPFENDFVESVGLTKKITASKYDSYASLEKESPMSARVSNFRFKYDKELSSENLSGSPASPRPRHSSPPPPAPSLFEDDFSPEPRNGILRALDTNGDTRKETIHEGEELRVLTKEERTEKMVGFDFGSGKEGLPENRRSQKLSNKNRPKVELDIKKSESVNIFSRESDPFDGDDFFNCTASDRPRRDNWQASFDNM